MDGEQMLNSYIKAYAYLQSKLRRLESFMGNHENLYRIIEGIQSTEQEMIEDWNLANAFIVSEILSGKIPLNQVYPESYPILENVWEKNIKLLKAYYIWMNNSKTGDTGSNYYSAASEIRNLLYNAKTFSLNDFAQIRTYLQNKYLGRDGKLDETKNSTKELIKCKASRIFQTTGNTNELENWFRAKRYIKMYYENIIPAILDEDDNSIYQVLKAFEFSKSPNNRFLIINCFEAVIAIYFLNKTRIKNIIAKPPSYVFNMVPVKDWPKDFTAPSTKLRFDTEEKLITYEGVMDPSEKNKIMNLLMQNEHKWAIDELYWQSNLTPFEAMIL